MEIREATEADTQAIQKLYETLVSNADVNVDPRRIEEIAKDSNNFLFVICANSKIEGTCFVTLCLDPMFGSQPYCIIENVVINPELRNSGLGQNMLKYVEHFCLNKDCSKIMLQSSISRKEAHGFFESLGYERMKKAAFVKYRSHFTNE
jgi:N-acetylglutamate synthase-like GNAT family acetyltransferase